MRMDSPREIVVRINLGRGALHRDIIAFKRKAGDVAVAVAMQWSNCYDAIERSFANGLETPEGGTHLAGFRDGLARALHAAAAGVTTQDLRVGLGAVVSVRMPNPRFASRSGAKLSNRAVRAVVEAAVCEGLAEYFRRHPRVLRAVIRRAALEARVRVHADVLRDVKRRAAFAAARS